MILILHDQDDDNSVAGGQTGDLQAPNLILDSDLPESVMETAKVELFGEDSFGADNYDNVADNSVLAEDIQDANSQLDSEMVDQGGIERGGFRDLKNKSIFHGVKAADTQYKDSDSNDEFASDSNEESSFKKPLCPNSSSRRILCRSDTK